MLSSDRDLSRHSRTSRSSQSIMVATLAAHRSGESRTGDTQCCDLRPWMDFRTRTFPESLPIDFGILSTDGVDHGVCDRLWSGHSVHRPGQQCLRLYQARCEDQVYRSLGGSMDLDFSTLFVGGRLWEMALLVGCEFDHPLHQ